MNTLHTIKKDYELNREFTKFIARVFTKYVDEKVISLYYTFLKLNILKC